MPKIGFSSENKQRSAGDYPKLWFQQQDEKARIVCIEPEPEVGYVHVLRAPRIVNGELVMKKVTNRKTNETTEVPEMDFIGRHMCFGNFDTLIEKGKDPQNCPTCEAANEHDYIGGADRRFAMHIVRYKTQPGSFKVQHPFGAELLAWTFSNKVFDTLTDIGEEHGDLRKKDLLLTCTNKTYQNVEIQVGGSAEWLTDSGNTDFVKRLYAENKSEDLSALIARKVSREMAMDDIAKVRLRHARAFGGTVDPVSASGGAGAAVSAGMNLDSLLSDDADTPSPSEPEQESPVKNEPEAAPETTPEVSEPEEASQESSPEPEEKKDKGDTLDFDSILAGL